MSLRILFKLTTRKRPEQAQRAIDSINNNVVDSNYHILVSVDEDDDSWRYLRGFHHICVGESKNKIDAINRDVNKYGGDWDILVNVSDDQIFIKKGFDDIIRDSFGTNADQVIHFPDGNRKDLMTMSIIGRNYYNRDKYIYHPSYFSVYCDDEAQEVAKERKCYKFVDNHIFNHEHPAYGKGNYDNLYQENDKYYAADKANYELRKSKGFPA